MRERFDTLKLPASIVDAFPPDELSLFHRVRALIEDRHLEWIASLDYGDLVAEHLKELRFLKAGENLREPMDWEPNEVLELCRWDDPERKERSNFDARERHLARTFSCCCLLLTENHCENRTMNEPDTVAPLVESILSLAIDGERDLACFLVHILQRMEPWDEEFLFVAYCLMLLLAEANIASRETQIDFSGWFADANRQIMPWHEQSAKRNAKTFLDIQYVTIHKASWKSYADRIRKTAPFQVDLFAMLELISPKK